MNDLLDLLERWERFGGHWTVIATDAGEVTLSLRRCDGGEELERHSCARSEFELWLAGRSDDTVR